MSRFGAVLAGLAAALLMAPAALVTVPGPNGLIAFTADTGNGYQLYTIGPDGSGQ